MKAKIFSLMALSILALIFLTGFSSATVYFTPTSFSQTVEQGSATTFSFTATEDGQGNLTGVTFNTLLTFISGSNSFNSTNLISGVITSLTNGTTSTPMSLTINVPEYQTPGIYIANLTMTGTYYNSTNSTVITSKSNLPITITVTQKPRPSEINACFATGDPKNNLRVRIEDTSVVSGYGGADKDTDWFPLDNIQVEVSVKNENTADYRLRNIIVRWGLYDLDNKDWIFSNKEKSFTLRSEDSKTLYLNFKLDKPKDFKYGGKYKFFVWANAEDSELDGNETCQSSDEPVSIIQENNFVVLDNVQLDGVSLDSSGAFPQQVSCGTKLHLTADVWNVGENDQKDVSLRIYNKDLGVDGTVKVGDIDAFEKKTVSFDLPVIPQGIDEKWYPLELSLYDEDNYIYQDDYNNDKSLEVVLLNIAGNCVLPKGTLTANLDSGGKAGRELVIKATVTNSGKEVTNYSLSPSGYSDWATLENVSPSEISIEPGKTADVYLTFKVDSKVSGEKLFNLDLSSQGEQVTSQPVSVSIEKSFIGSLLGNNSTQLLTYLIIGVVIILILIIIVLAIKLSRK